MLNRKKTTKLAKIFENNNFHSLKFKPDEDIPENQYFLSNKIIGFKNENEIYFILFINNQEQINKSFLVEVQSYIFLYNENNFKENNFIKFNTNLIIFNCNSDSLNFKSIQFLEKDRNNCRKIIIETEDDFALLPFLNLSTDKELEDIDFESKFNEITESINDTNLLKLLKKTEELEEETVLEALGIKNYEPTQD